MADSPAADAASEVHSDADCLGAVSSLRWIVLGLTWATLLVCFVDRLAWGNVALDVGRDLHLPLTALGAFVTAYYVGYVVSCVAGGFVTDVIGARRALGMSLVLLGIATFAFGFTRSFLVGICIQAVMGLVSSVDYSGGIKLNTSWFPRTERGLAIGLYMTATSLAVVIANAVVPALRRSYDWPQIYFALGAATIIAGILCYAALRDPPQGEGAPSARPDFRILLRKRDLLFLALAGFGAMWGTWGFAFWANALMVKGRGFAPADAANIMILFGIGAIVSKPVLGFISDWLGGARKIPLVIVLSSFAVALVVFGGIGTEAGFRAMAPVLGVVAFVYSPLMGVMIAEVAGPQLAGSAVGLTNAVWQLGSVIVPVVVGAVFDATGSFYAAFITLALGPVFGMLCMLLVARR